MTSKERMMRALNREKPDRLPVTVHQWQQYHLDQYLGGIDDLTAFRKFGMDAAVAYFEAVGQFWMPGADDQTNSSPDWREESAVVKDDPDDHIRHYTITTPGGTLTYKTGGNRMTTWITEYLIKKPEDVELIAKYMPVPRLNKLAAAKAYERLGDDGILRGFVWGDQAGCWQHACSLYGEQEMIYSAHDDPAWVHRVMEVLLAKKLQFIEELMDLPSSSTSWATLRRSLDSSAIMGVPCLRFARAHLPPHWAWNPDLGYDIIHGDRSLFDSFQRNLARLHRGACAQK